MIQVNIDCEGPITLNDNAFEICKEFIPQGEILFAKISRYDDYLSDVEKRMGYKAGDTLKLILPFLIAHNVTQENLTDFSLNNLSFLGGAKELLKKLSEELPVFIISTSYKPYLIALSQATGFSEKNIYCTDINLNNYFFSEQEKSLLMELSGEIISLPIINLENIRFLSDIKDNDKKIIKRMDEIFWQIIPKIPECKKIFEEINPIGGTEKADAILKSIKITGLELKNCIYIGDSITDVQALNLVKNNNGLSIAFNGNDYAIRAAEFAIAGDTFILLYKLLMLCKENGVQFIKKNWKDIQRDLKDSFPQQDDKGYIFFHLITPDNLDFIRNKSHYFRKKVRGAEISNLG